MLFDLGLTSDIVTKSVNQLRRCAGVESDVVFARHRSRLCSLFVLARLARAVKPAKPAIRDLSRIFVKVCCDFGTEFIACNGEDDHVHLLIVYPPKVALSKLVNSLKDVSSRLLREWRPEVRGRYKGSPSYFVASCGGAPLTVIAEYVKSQRAPPSGREELDDI